VRQCVPVTPTPVAERLPVDHEEVPPTMISSRELETAIRRTALPSCGMTARRTRCAPVLTAA